MIDFKQPSMSAIEYEIHGIHDVICNLKLGMLKRSAGIYLKNPEEEQKDRERYQYISFLKRKMLANYRAARVYYGYTGVTDAAAFMCMDRQYANMLEKELENTPKGPLYSAIAFEITRTNCRIMSYPSVVLEPYSYYHRRISDHHAQ